jgi:mannosyltransferase
VSTAQPASPGTGQSLARSRWLWLVPPAVTLTVMVWGIRGASYWRDEAATLAAVQRPFGALLRMLGHVDAVHGAYYMLIWGVVRMAGTGELATRLPSAVAMAAASSGVSAIGRRLVSLWAGLAAGLLFAVLPEVSFYGQDARSYAIVTALAVAASYLLVRLLESGASTRWLAAYAACLAVLGAANIFSLLLIPAHGLTVMMARPQPGGPGRGRVTARWAVASLLPVLLVSPLIDLGYAERQQISWIKPAGIDGIITVRELIGPAGLTMLVAVIVALSVAFCLLRGRVGLRAGWPPRLLALSLPWLVLPPALLLTASLIQPVYLFRYIMFCLPAVALLGGAALAALGPAVGPVALVLVVLLALPAQFRERRPAGHGDNIRGLDALIAAAARPGDGVYYVQEGARTAAAAYPYGLDRLRDVALSRTAVQAGKLAGTNVGIPLLPARLARASRVWVVETKGRVPVPVLRHLHYRVAGAWPESTLWAVLYVRTPARPRHHRHTVIY